MPRTYGSGTVYKDKRRPNTYVGEVELDGRRRRVTGRTKTECSQRLAKLIRDHHAGELSANANATVGQMLDRWLEVGMPRDRAPKTIENNEWAVRVLRAELGRKRLARLTVVDVERALRNIAAGKQSATDRPASRRQLVLMRATLRRVLRFAARRGQVGGVAATAAEYAELPAQVPDSEHRTALTAEQARALWAACESERLGAMFRLQLLTGMRPGEAAGLCWDAVDFDAGTITVRRAIQMVGNRPSLTDDLKTAASRRRIAVGLDALNLLREQRKLVLEMRVGSKTWTDCDLVFPTTNGTPWHPRNARRELERICLQAGLPRVRPNELRHTAASILSDRGVSHARVADLLGHSNTRMVDQTYRHNLQSTSDAAIEGGLADIMNGSSK